MSTKHARFLAMALGCGIAVLQPLAGSQQSAETSRKTAPPEQRALQQREKDDEKKRLQLQRTAKHILDTEAAREKAGDCPAANTTYAINVCLGQRVAITDKNLKSLEVIVRSLHVRSEDSDPPVRGAALTPTQFLAQFNRVEKSWWQYRTEACTAASDQYEGATGAPAGELQCQLGLDRSHMRELDMIYGQDLHL